jgi:succinylglutamate desuccinylase
MPLQPFRRIAIVGGTHGNENNGTFVIDAYRKNGGRDVERQSFQEVNLVIGNPAAVARTVRFVDEDLNRSFTVEGLRDLENPSLEAARSKALNSMLGPKPGSRDAVGAPMPDSDEADPAAVDFIIDLHTTTANMGCSLMANPGVSVYVAAYARAWLDNLGMPCKIVMSGEMARAAKGGVGTMGRSNIVVECGPTPNGLVRHDIVSWMREATGRILDCLDCMNRNVVLPMPPAGSWGSSWARGISQTGLPSHIVVNRPRVDPGSGAGKIAVPIDESGRPSVMFAPSLQDGDFRPLRKGDPVFINFKGEVVQRYDGGFGDEAQPIFVNEAGYYFASSGLGFMLSREEEVPLHQPHVTQVARL